jgi:hypothetical protein
MAKTTNTVLALAMTGAGVWGAWSLGQSFFGDDSSVQGTEWVVNHIWVERLPENERDMIGHLALIRHPRARIGVAGRSSQWRHFIELFKWGLERDRLSLFFPQEEVKAKVKVRTWKCAGEAPEPFEICLEVSSGRRKATYYSREDWIIDVHDIDASRERITSETPELAGVFEQVVVDAPLPTAEPQVERYTEIDWLPARD